MSKRRVPAYRRFQRPAPVPTVSRPLGWLLSAASVNVLAAGPAHNVDAVSGFTTVSTTGTNTQQVVNNYTSGGVAVNVFNHFVVGDGNTVNLQVPNGAKLVNIVRSSRPEVWGVLNAYENNKLGGDVTFASADGFLVGSTGIVNVGKLTLRTPSQTDIDNFVSGNKAIGDLTSGTYSLSSSGLVTIQGKVNTRDGVVIHADQVSVAAGATVIAGDAKSASYVSDAAVNTGDLSAPKTLQQTGGTISIVAQGKSGTAVDISGSLLADGGITIEAPTIALNSGSKLDTERTGGSATGAVTLTASAEEKIGMGEAVASTSITLGGSVVATDFSASASSHARSSYTEDIGIWVATTSVGLFTGLNANWVAADADATLTVGSTASLTASGNLTLASQARALAEDPAVTLNGNSLVGAAVVYGKATSDSTTQVTSGAQLSAGGKLSVTAHNENTLSASALTLVATNENTAVVSVAVGEASAHSKALVEAGASVSAGSVAVHAENQNSFYVNATAYGLSGTALGATVAYGNLATSAIADMGASVGTDAAKVGDVEVLALDRTTRQRVHSSSTVGKSLLFRTLGAAPVAALGAAQGFVNGAVSRVVPVNAAVDLARNADGSLDFRVGAAFTLSEYDHESVAHLGNNVAGQSAPTVVSSGNVVVGARTDVREMRTSSESSVSARTDSASGTPSDPAVANSASVAINLAIGNSRSTAEVGDHVNVTAARVGVAAEQWQPLVSTYNRWDSFGDYLDHLTPTAGLGTSLLSGFANASGEAEENAIAFSFNLQVQGHDTKAWVGSRAKLTSTAAAGDWTASHTLKDLGDFADASYSFGFDGAIGVQAYSQAQTLDIAGNMGALLIGAAVGAGEDGSSLGASMSYVGSTSNTVAGIGSGATVNAGAGDLAVDATSDDAHIVVAPTSGMGSGTAFNGIVGVFSMDNETRASLHNSANVTASAVDVQAHQYAGNWAAAGSFAYTDSKAIGVAVAINDSEANTRALVGDNSDDDALVAGYGAVSTTYTGSAPTAGLTTDSLTVHATTDGTSGAIAAAGSATTPKTGEPGYGKQFENKWLALQSKLASKFSSASSGSGSSSVQGASGGGQQNSGSGDSVAQNPDAGLGISGSVAASVSDLDTQAQVSGVTVTARTTRSAIDVQALEKTVQVSAAGSAAFIMAAKDPAASSTTAFSGAVAYQLSGNDAEALLSNVTAMKAGDVTVQAAQAGQRLGIGLGFSVNTNSASGKNYSVGVSASAAEVEDSASARIENSTLDAQDGSRSLDVQAYSRTDIGIGGGSLFGGGKGGVGLAVTYAEIGNGERNATEVLVSNSQLTDFSSVDLTAKNASRIASGAASLGGGNDALGFAGSFVINDVGGTHGAALSGSTASGVGTLNLDVSGQIDGTLDTVLDALGTGSENGTYDFSGSLLSDFAAPGNQSDTGARVLGVAGFLQVGKSNLGLAYTHNDLHQTHEAAITGSTVSASSVKVNAEDESWAVAVSAGMGVSTGTLSGVGSVAVNEVNNQLTSRIGTWDAGTASGSITAGSISVTAQNRADVAAGAGSIAASKGSSGGLAVALNLVGTSEHATTAQVAWTDLYTSGNVDVSATSGTSGDPNSLTAIGIGVGLAQGGLAFAGAIGVNNVDQTVDAAIQAVSTTQGGTTHRAATVSVTAEDHSGSDAWGFMAAGSSNGAAGAVGIATNRIDSDVTAEVMGGRSSTLYANSLLIDASRHNDLLTVNAGLAGSTGLTGAASIGTNVTDGHVLAKIGSGAKVDALNHVKVSALADTFSAVGSGAVGVGTGAASGAVAVSTAVDFGVTEALVDNAEVKALGRSGSVNIGSGALANGPTLTDLSTSADGVDRDALSQNFEDQTLQEGTQGVTGLAVNATSYQKLRTINVAGAGGTGAAAVAVNVATNDFEGSTTAAIRNSTINNGVSGEAGADVTVRGSDHSMGLAISAGLAGASQGAGIAGLSMNLQTHDVDAQITGSTVRADALAIDATATQMAQAVSAGGAGGGTGAGAASVVVTTQYGGVNAWLQGGTTTAGSVAVGAERQQESDVAAGAAAGAGQVGVGFGLAVSRIGGDTWATIGRDPDDDNATTVTTVNAGAVTVDAARSTVVNSYAFGAGVGVGATGIAGMVNVSDQAGDTRAGMYDTTLRGADGTSAAGSLRISADEIYSAEQHAAGAGVGLVGIGATFNVALSSSSTVAELVGSDVKATTTTVDAEADREAFVTSVAGGAGKFAGAVSLGFVKFGAGDSGGADSELANSAAAADTTVNTGYGAQNTQLTADEQNSLDSASGGLDVASRVQNTAVSADATTTGDGSTLKVPDASLLAARVSGGTLVTDSLTVRTDGRTHTYTVAGAVQGSLAGLSGGLGISRQYLVNSAIVDGNVTADSVSVTATERDGAGGAAGEVEAFTAGVGGLVIGVAYSDVLVQNRVVAGVSRAIGDDSNTLTVSAVDSSSVKVGGDNENSPENVSVGLGVIGATVVRAEKDSDVDAWAGKNGYKLDGYDAMTVGASVSGQVRATGFSVSAGVVDVTGVSANAEDNSSADAQLIGGADTGSDAVLTVTASAKPETYARAYGVAVGAGAGVGGSFAYATANTSVKASIADNAVFSGSGSVSVNATTGETDTSRQGSYFSADAQALAASGGLLLGLVGTEVTAKNSSQTRAELGDYVTLPTGDLAVTAFGYSGQRAEGDAYFGGGILGFGKNTATAWSATSTRVLMGKNPVADFTREGEFTLTAVGADRNEAFATGGGGGAISGSAAEAVVKAADSDAAPAVLVEVEDWTSSRSIVGTAGLKILAEHSTQFFTGADTTAVSVIGASAANATTTIDVDAKVKLGQYVGFDSQAVDVAAVNAIEQISSPSLSGWDVSVNAGAGGGINGYAAGSTINIDNQGASISLGDRASLDVFAVTAHETLGNRLRLDAYSTLSLTDQAQLSTGGAIQRADAASTITAVANNSITLGQNVELDNDVDTVQLGTYSVQNVWASANAKTYGGVGGAAGEVDIESTVNNTVTLGANAVLTGYGSISLYAGRSGDGITDNTVLLNAVSDVYNWTAAPITTTVKADAHANVNNNVNIGSGASVASVRNIWLEADEGRVYTTGTGRGHNPYLELFSSETKAGSGTSTTSSTVTFAGSATLEAGTRYNQSVTINSNGTVTKGTGTEATVYDLGNFSSRASLQAYIDELTAEKAVTDAYVATLDASAQASYTYSARYQEVESQLSFLEPLLSELSASTSNAVVVANVTAAGGDVHLTADTVKVTSGTPIITAHGDPTITITNNSAKALIVDTLTIPNDAGGQVLVSGGASNSLPAALKVVESGGGSGSQITITHNPGVDGVDLVVQGDITNLGGKVTVDVKRGSMLQTASIYAKQMELTVADVYLVNTSGTVSYGFSPLALSGYVTSGRGWKPASAEEAVMWYISDRYESEIKNRGIAGFNSWWYGTDYASRTDTIWSQIYLNWGFNNADECSTGCTTFNFPNNSGGSTRGSGDWRFDSVVDYTGKLRLTTDYNSIKNSGFLGTAVTKDALNASFIAVNAGTIDINGTIRAGNFNNWSVDIASSFDSAIATYIDKKGLSANDTISITPGQPLYYTERAYSCTGFICGWKNKTVALDTGVSLASSGDAGIGLTYDVGTGKLALADVNASGNGTVMLRGKIVSTGADGKVLVDDGLGTIRVNNASGKELVVNDLNAGTQSTGIIRITDTNYSNRTDWYVHTPGGLVQHYVTGSSATTYTGATPTTEGWYESGNATTSYQPRTGQWYKWTESASVVRSYTDRSSNNLAQELPTGEWKWSNQDSPWTVGSGSIVTSCSACTGDYLTGVFNYGSTNGYDAFPVDWTYSDYYGNTFVNKDWVYYVPKGLSMSVDYYVKADHPVKLQFVGAAQGTVEVGSRTNLTLNGSISNSQGTTTLASTGGGITASAGAVVNSAALNMSAAGNLGSSSQALTAITSLINASAGGSVNLDLTAQSSSIALQQIAAGTDVTVVADKSLLPTGSGTHLAGRNVTLTGTFGGLGDVSAGQTVNTAITGTLTVDARGDIALRQASGDLTLNTLTAEGGDVSITLGNGRLLNGIDSSGRSSEETAYLAQVWQSLNLTGADAGQETVKAFENQVSAQYQLYHLIKQRLADDSDAGFTIAPAYLEAMRTRVALQQGVSAASLGDAAVTAAVKAEYQGVQSFFSSQFGASLPFDTAAAFDSSWRYTLDPASALYATLTSGARWKQSQLDVAISEAALTPVTSAYVSSRAANISGNNVTLNTSAGSVGQDAASLSIAISRSNPSLSDDEKAALVGAGPGDLSFVTTDTQLLATVKQQDPVKVNATGVFRATSRDEVYVESDQSLALGGVQSSQGDVRLSAGGSITSASGNATTVSAEHLNIAVSQGSIGSVSAPIRLSLTEALRVASAPGDIYVSHAGGVLALGSLGAGGTLSVSAGGALTNWASNGSGYHLLADSIDLGASGGDLGTAARPLRLRLVGGTLTLAGDDAHVEVDSTGLWDLGSVSLSGALALQANSDLHLAGSLNATSANLHTTGEVSAASVNWSTTGATSVDGSVLSLASTNLSASQLTLQATAGDLDAGTLQAHGGDLTLLATGDIGLYGALSTSGRWLADGQSLQMQVGSSATVGGAATLTAIDAMQITGLQASGDVSLTAGTLDVAQALQGADVGVSVQQQASLAAGGTTQATGTLTLDAQQLDMGTGSVLRSGGALTATTTGDQTLAVLEAGGALALHAGGALAFNGVVTAGQGIDLVAQDTLTIADGVALQSGADFTVQVQDLQAGTSSRLVSGANLQLATAGDARVAQAEAAGSFVLQAGGAASIGESAMAQGDLQLQAAHGFTAAGTLQGANVALDAQGVTLQAGTTVTASQALTVDAQQLLMGQGSTLAADGRLGVTTSGNQALTRLAAGGDLVLQADGAVTLEDGASAQGAMDLQAASFDMAPGSRIDAGRGLVISTMSGAQTLATLDVSGNVTLQSGRGVTLQESVNAGHTLNVNASGAFVTAPGITVQAGDALLVQAQSVAAGLGSRLVSGTDLSITSTDDATLAQLEAGQDLNVQAGTMARLTEAASAQRDAWLQAGTLRVQGGLNLPGQLQLRADIDVALASDVHAGAVTVDAATLALSNGVTLRSDGTLDVTAGEVTMGSGSRMLAGGDLQLGAQGNLVLARLDAANVALQAGGALTLNDNVTGTQSVALSAGQALTVADGVQVQAGDALSAQASSLAAGASSRLVAGGDMQLTATGDVLVAQLGAGGSLALNAGGAVRSAEAVAVQGGAAIDADSLTVDGGWVSQGALTVQADQAVALNSNVQAGGAVVDAATLQMATGVTLRSTGAVTVDADAIAMGSGSKLESGSTMSLTTQGQQTLAQLSAGTDLTLQAGGAVALNEQAMAGGALRVTAGGPLTVAGGTTVQAGDALSLQTSNLTAGASSRIVSSADMQLTATGDMLVAQLDAGGNLTLNAGNAVRSTEAVAVQGSAAVEADSVTVDGGWVSQGALDVQARQAVALNSNVAASSVALDAATLDVASGVALRGVGALSMTGDAVSMGTGSLIESGADMRLATQGQQTLARLNAGGDLVLQAGGAVALSEQAMAGGALSVTAGGPVTVAGGITVQAGDELSLQAGSLTAGASSRIASGADMGLAVGGDVLMARLAAGGSLTLNAGGAVRSTEGVEVQGDAAVAADSLTVDGRWTSQGALDVQARRSVAFNTSVQAANVTIDAATLDVASGITLRSVGALSMTGDAVSMGTGSLIESGADMRLATQGQQTLARLNAGGDLVLQAGGVVALSEQATAGGALRGTAGGPVTVAGGITVQAGDELTLQASSLTAGASSRIVSGADMQLTTTGDVLVAQLDAGGNLALTSGGAVRTAEAVAVQGDTVIAADSLAVDGGWTSQGGLDVRANQAVALNSDVQAAHVAVDAGTLDLANGVALRGNGAVALSADAIAMGAGSAMESGSTMSLTAQGDQALAQLSAGTDLTLQAGGAVALNEQATAGGALSVTAGGPVTVAGGITVQAGDALSVQANSLTAGASSRVVSGADMQLTADGGVLVAQLDAGGHLTLNAGGAARTVEAIAVRGDAVVAANSFTVDGGWVSQGGLEVRANQAVALNSDVQAADVAIDAATLDLANGVALRSAGSLNVNSGAIAMSTASAMDAGSTMSLTTLGDQVLAQLSAGGDLTLQAGGTAALNEQVSAGGALSATAGGSLTAAGGITVQAGNALSLQASSLMAGSASRIVSGADTQLAATGDVQVAQLGVGGNLTLNAGGAARSAEAVAVQGDASVTADGMTIDGGWVSQGNLLLLATQGVTLNSDVSAANVAVDASGIELASGVTLRSANALVVNGDTVAMGAGSAMDAGSAMSLTTQGDQTLARLSAGTGLTLLAGGAVALNEQATAGGALNVRAGGPLTVAAGITVQAGDVLTLQAGSLTAGASSRIASGADMGLAVGGDVVVAQLAAGGSLTLNAGGAVRSTEGVKVQGDAAVAADSLAVDGGWTSQGALDVQAGRSVAFNTSVQAANVAIDAATLDLANGVMLRSGGSLSVNAGAITMANASVLSTAGDTTLVTSGSQTLATLAAGGNVTLQAGDAVALNEQATAGGVLSVTAGGSLAVADGITVQAGDAMNVQAGSLTAGASSRIVSGSDVQLTTTGDVLVAQLDASGNLSLNASGAVRSAEAVSVQGDAVVAAGSLTVDGGWVTQGSLNVEANETVALNSDIQAADVAIDAASLNLSNGVSLHSAGALAVNADAVSMGSGSVMASGFAMSLTTQADQALARLSAGTDLTLQAGGAISLNEQVTAGGAMHVTAGGPLTMAGGITVQAGGAMTMQADSLAAGASSRLVSGGDMQLAAAGGALVAQLDAGGNFALTAGSAARSSEAVTVQGDAIVDADSFTVDGGWVLQGALTVRANREVALNRDAQANSVAVDAATLDLANGVALRSAGAVTVNADAIAMGSGSVMASGSAMSLTTQDAQALARLSAGTDLTLQAGRAIALNEQAAAGGAMNVTAGGSLDVASGITVQAGDALTVQASSVTAGASSRIVSGADMQLTTTGEVLVAELAAGGNLVLTAGGAARSAEAVTVQGNALVDADSLTVDGGWTSQGTLGVVVDKAMALNSDVQASRVTVDATTLALANGVALRSADALTVNAGAITMAASSTLGAASDMTLVTSSDQTLATLTAGRNLQLQAGGVLTLNEQAVAGGAVNATAGDALTIASGITVQAGDALTVQAGSLTAGASSRIVSGADMQLTATGDALVAQLDAGGNLALNAGGAARTAEAVAVQGDAVVAADSLTVDGGWASQGALDVHTHQAAALDSDVQAARVAVDAATLKLANGVTLRSAGALSVNAGIVTMAASSVLNAGGDMTLTTSAGQTLATLLAGDDLGLQAGSAVALNEQATVGGSLNATAGGALTIASGITVQAGDALTVQANSLTAGASSRIVSGAGMQLTADGDVLVAQLGAGGSLALNAGGAVRSAEAVTVQGDAVVDADSLTVDGGWASQGALGVRTNQAVALNSGVQAGNVAVDAAALDLADGVTLRSDGTLSVNAGAITMANASVLNAAGDMALATTAGQTLATLTAGGNLQLQAGGALALQADVQAGGNATLQSAGATTLAGGRSLTAGGAFNAEAAEWQMGQGSRLQAEGDLRLQAAGDVLLASVTGHGELLSVNAGGMLRGRADAPVHVGSDDAVTRTELQAGLGIGDPLVVDVPWLSVATRSGDIHLVVERDVYSPLISAENGNVTMAVHGSLNFEQLLGNPNLWIDGRMSGTQVTMRQGSLASREELQVQQVTLLGGGPLAVAAPRVALAVDAAGAPQATLSVTGFDGARAENVALQVTGTQRVEITRLVTHDAQLVFPVDVALRDASASGELTLTTPAVTLSLDNLNPAARPADAQLITPSGSFWLQLQGNGLYTDALVTRFQSPVALYFHRPDEQKLVAQQAFYRMSTEHLSQEVAGTSWRVPMQLKPLLAQASPALAPFTGLVPAVNFEGLPPTAAGPREGGPVEEDLVIEAPATVH